jgi:hypothetical protein
MSETTITQDQVVEAAKSLDKDEFTRGEVVAKLEAKPAEIKDGFRAARRAGQVEKNSNGNEDEKPTFRLTGN